jgi:hypothetical protein
VFLHVAWNREEAVEGSAMGERIFWAANFAVMAAIVIIGGGAIAYIAGALG